MSKFRHAAHDSSPGEFLAASKSAKAEDKGREITSVHKAFRCTARKLPHSWENLFTYGRSAGCSVDLYACMYACMCIYDLYVCMLFIHEYMNMRRQMFYAFY